MTRYDDNDDRPTLLDETPSGQKVYLGDESPTVLDETPDGRPIYTTGPK